MLGANKNPFGAFGSSTPNTNSSIFGSSSYIKPASGAFASNSGAFGSTQNQGSVFGSSSMFGSNPTSAFGAQVAGSGFTSQSTPSVFGSGFQSSNSSSIFGSSQTPSTNAFGQSSFGQSSMTNTAGSVFGSSSSSAFGGALNLSTVVTTNVVGTTIKYNPPSTTDTVYKNNQTQQVNVKFVTITTMREYESKSLEELRFEDYTANRKGPAGFGANTSMFSSGNSSVFGASQQQPSPFSTSAASTNTGGLFGSQPAQNTLFGSKPIGFASPATQSSGFGTFGQNNTGNSGLFGAGSSNTSSGGLFGSALSSSSNSGFGGQQSLFGSSTSTAAPGFGQTSNTMGGSLFGAPQSSGFGSGFGNANQSGSSVFGSQSQQKLFGTATTSSGSVFGSAFGQSNSNAFGSFAQSGQSAVASTSSGFNAFGSNNSGSVFGSAFKSSQPASGGLFGQSFGSNTGSSLFGSSNTANSAFGFGSNQIQQPSSSSLFGSSNQSQGLFQGGSSLFGQVATTQSSLFGSQPPQVATQQSQAQSDISQTHQLIMSLTANRFGGQPLTADLPQSSISKQEAFKQTNPQTLKAITDSKHYKISPFTSERITPRPLASMSKKHVQVELFDGLDDDIVNAEGEQLIDLKPRQHVKHFDLRAATSPIVSQLNSSIISADIQTPPTSSLAVHSSSTNKKSILASRDKSHNDSFIKKANVRFAIDTSADTPDIIRGRNLISKIPLDYDQSCSADESISAYIAKPRDCEPHNGSLNASNLSTISAVGLDETLADEHEENDTLATADTMVEPHPSGVQLTRPGYYTQPSLDDLRPDPVTGRLQVNDFTIARRGYGSAHFAGTVDITGLNLDQLVFIKRREICVYPDDACKPPVGEALNRSCVVTLVKVWPTDKCTREQIRDAHRLEEMGWETRLERSCRRSGTKFVEYTPDTGSWVFKVNHFSKYGLDDSDDDMESQPTDTERASNAPVSKQPRLELPAAVSSSPSSVPVSAAAGVSPRERRLRRSHLSDADTPILPPQLFSVDPDSVQRSPLWDRHNKAHRDYADSILTYSSTTKLVRDMGLDMDKVTRMNMSFFSDRDDDEGLGDEMESQHEEQLPIISTRSALPSGLGGLRLPNLSEVPELELSGVRQEPVHGVSQQQLCPTGTLQASYRSECQPTLAAAEQKSRVVCAEPLISVDEMPLASSHSVVSTRRHAPQSLGTLVPWKQSLRCAWGDLHFDPVCLKAYSNRTSWSPFYGIVHVTDSEHLSPFSVSHTQIVCVSDFATNPLQYTKMLEDLFGVLIDHSTSTTTLDIPGDLTDTQPPEETVGRFSTLWSSALPRRMAVAHTQHASVWRLIHALWTTDTFAVNISEYRKELIVKMRLSEWLQSECKSEVADQIKCQKSFLSVIFLYLSIKEIEEAVQLCVQNADYRLSLILTQAIGSDQVRQLLRSQLQHWLQSASDVTISTEMLRIYMLISGTCCWTTSDGRQINLCHSLSWKRTFALHLWYFTPVTASIRHVLLAYEKSSAYDALEGRRLVPYPWPAYVSQRTAMDLTSEHAQEHTDICYQLLHLYCNGTTPLTRLLETSSYTREGTDTLPGWLFMQCLLSLDYCHLPEQACMKLSMSAAAQLEAANLFHLAVFILQHIADNQLRYRYVTEVLLRHVSTHTCQSTLEFLTGVCHIPDPLIAHVMAINIRGTVDSEREQLELLLRAHRWQQVYDLFLNSPSLSAYPIIDDDWDSLLPTLRTLHAHSEHITDWQTGGALYWNCVQVCDALTAFKRGTDNTRRLAAALRDSVEAVCVSWAQLPSHTPHHRLARREIAKKMTVALQILHQLDTDSLSTLASRNDDTAAAAPEDAVLDRTASVECCTSRTLRLLGYMNTSGQCVLEDLYDILHVHISNMTGVAMET